MQTLCTYSDVFSIQRVALEEKSNMNDKIVHEILDELFSLLEALDTQSSGVLQFLKDKGIAPEKELAPYLEQAGNASSVRWLAARVRIDYLLSSAMKAPEEDAKEESPKATENSQEANADTNKSGEEETEKDAKGAQVGSNGESPADDAENAA
jgi:hypothetical protein